MDTGRYNQTQALKIVGDEYGGVSRSGLRRYIFSKDKNYQIEYSSAYWKNKEYDSADRARRNADSAPRMNARHHIADIIESVYRNAMPKRELTLVEIAQCIHDESSVNFLPKTLLHLNERYRERNGQSLIEAVAGTSPVAYRYAKR